MPGIYLCMQCAIQKMTNVFFYTSTNLIELKILRIPKFGIGTLVHTFSQNQYNLIKCKTQGNQ